ncbi:MAG: tetratricopeptide repeat protein, partial [Candidatus Omnitrophica bacterium]|nr:tetratricopeptide repeat protein [Candidatus Omnitrophota bacterium]
KSYQNANTFYYLGLCYRGLNNRSQAIQYFQQALQLNPHHRLAQEQLNMLTRY